MMYVLIAIVSLIASLLTFFSGFGLGTLLLPVFALFFDLPTSIGLTAIVHFSNNVFKFFLTGRNADKHVLIVFGIPSVIAAVGGALLLDKLAGAKALFAYEVAGHAFSISSIGLIIGVIMIVFAIWEIIPFLKDLSFGKHNLVLGGILSGFFGGLSGYQGALRSAFLIRLEQSKQTFIATGIVIACFVDIARMIIYAGNFPKDIITGNYVLLAWAVVSAWTGAFIGNMLLKKTTYSFMKWMVAVFMITIGILVASGILSK